MKLLSCYQRSNTCWMADCLTDWFTFYMDKAFTHNVNKHIYIHLQLHRVL